jgi:hypothetical protein
MKVPNTKYQENPSGGSCPDACSLTDMMPGSPVCAFLNQFKKKNYWRYRVSLSICPSFRTEQPSSHWTDFHGILYLGFLRKFVDYSTFVKIGQSKRYFTWRYLYIFLSDLLVFVAETRCVHCEVFAIWRGDFLYSLFAEVCALCYLPLNHSRLHLMTVSRFVATKTLLHHRKQVEFSRKQNVLILSQSMLLL